MTPVTISVRVSLSFSPARSTIAGGDFHGRTADSVPSRIAHRTFPRHQRASRGHRAAAPPAARSGCLRREGPADVRWLARHRPRDCARRGPSWRGHRHHGQDRRAGPPHPRHHSHRCRSHPRGRWPSAALRRRHSFRRQRQGFRGSDHRGVRAHRHGGQQRQRDQSQPHAGAAAQALRPHDGHQFPRHVLPGSGRAAAPGQVGQPARAHAVAAGEPGARMAG